MAEAPDESIVERFRQFYADYPPGSVAPFPAWGLGEKVSRRAISAALKNGVRRWAYGRDSSGRLVVRFLPPPGMLYGMKAVYQGGQPSRNGVATNSQAGK
jgi:hypothetical protein